MAPGEWMKGVKMILIDENKLVEAMWNLAEEAFSWQVLFEEAGKSDGIASLAAEGIGREIDKIIAMGEKVSTLEEEEEEIDKALKRARMRHNFK